ncbi:hypothetical protein CkaCkLH20_13054 [Colletotrichum karsti]|uniref:NADH dehydrogenase [ubiquinone] 1 beta subcomplex subunit 2 n=1 Tax=Colletotrichum karsti TaxID=1095194 RepID=A0A9P6HS00_9PEZI|nr:uncharacterized protein CkaCkLH20_13054 [Colletotrichum karsti]KAF9869457.1 hypothetical protein CkaCkLH20_13054 [Colletotrichum karsti]
MLAGTRPQLSNDTLGHKFTMSPVHKFKNPTPHVPGIYRYTATALGAGMWFFLMYRAKKDGAVLLGWKHPWDH